MNKYNLCQLFLLSIVLIAASCSKTAEKPKITISAYNIQSVTVRGVVQKILTETDPKKMHEIALAVESSRAVSCIPMAEECNLLGEILNKIVKATSSGALTDIDNVEINKLANQLDSECTKGQEKLAKEWKEYINSNAGSEAVTK